MSNSIFALRVCVDNRMTTTTWKPHEMPTAETKEWMQGCTLPRSAAQCRVSQLITHSLKTKVPVLIKCGIVSFLMAEYYNIFLVHVVKLMFVRCEGKVGIFPCHHFSNILIFLHFCVQWTVLWAHLVEVAWERSYRQNLLLLFHLLGTAWSLPVARQTSESSSLSLKEWCKHW